MLVNTKDMLLRAQQGKYAVGHFNTSNLEFSQAIINAAVAQRSPVILGVSVKALAFAGTQNLVGIVHRLAQEAPVPIALHLDHGPSLKHVMLCLESGFSSIMLDTSSKPYEENILLTQLARELCDLKGATLEAELGVLKGVEDDVVAAEHIYTDPSQAADFVQRTNVDSLAVAIGTSHGAYKFAGASKLDIARLQAIREQVSVPLVLHGASGVPQDVKEKAERFGAVMPNAHGVSDEHIVQAIANGICKVNTDTDLRMSFTAAGREFYATQPEDFDPRAFLAHTRAAVQRTVESRIVLFGSNGKA